tara:strand:+ start:203 stop:574 length:372 start_codon:yes stop_codon:yes gene_type:complete
MTTANATTNEQGYRFHGGASVGRALAPNELYCDKMQSSVNWKYQITEKLTVLKYAADNLVGIGAMRLAESYLDNTMSRCHIYKAASTRHTAIHCPDIKRVIIMNPRGGYVIRKDESFTGSIYL